MLVHRSNNDAAVSLSLPSPLSLSPWHTRIHTDTLCICTATFESKALLHNPHIVDDCKPQCVRGVLAPARVASALSAVYALCVCARTRCIGAGIGSGEAHVAGRRMVRVYGTKREGTGVARTTVWCSGT